MTIDQWSAFIKDRIIRIDKTLQIDKREVKKAMAIVYNQFLYEASEKKNDLDYYATEYTEVPLVLDDVSLRYYAEYPANIMKINGKMHDSIREIGTNAGEDLDIVLIMEKDYYLWAGQNVYLVDSTIRCIAENDRVVFLNGITQGLVNNGIRMEIIISIEGMSDSDELSVPSARDLEFVSRTLEIMGVTPPIDLKDDI